MCHSLRDLMSFLNTQYLNSELKEIVRVVRIKLLSDLIHLVKMLVEKGKV